MDFKDREWQVNRIMGQLGRIARKYDKPPLPHICTRCGKSGDADEDGWPEWNICAECAGIISNTDREASP